MAKRKPKSTKASVGGTVPVVAFEADVAAKVAQEHHRERRREKATKRCPSATWAEQHWYGDLHSSLLFDWRTPVPFPPGGGQTGMIRCGACQRYTPPNNVVRHLLAPICDDCAICPGRPTGQFDTLVEAEQRQSAVYEQLKQLGLTDGEIAVLSVAHDGNSIRQTAKLVNKSKTQVHRLSCEALAKLRAQGVTLESLRQGGTHRTTSTDPKVLDAMVAA